VLDRLGQGARRRAGDDADAVDAVGAGAEDGGRAVADQPARQDRVVADLGVRVERQVVGGNRDPAPEQGPEPLGETCVASPFSGGGGTWRPLGPRSSNAAGSSSSSSAATIDLIRALCMPLMFEIR
jgi:hypothetical protein